MDLTYAQYIKEYSKEEAEGLIEKDPCTFCPLKGNQFCNKAQGYGSSKPTFMVVSDFIHKGWVTSGKPFSGPMMNVLLPMLGKIGINIEDVYWTSLVKCATCTSLIKGKDKAPKKETITYCGRYLDAEIKKKTPTVIIACGQTTLEYFFPKAKMSEKRCQVLWSEEYKCNVVPIYNPEAMAVTYEFDDIIYKAFEQAYNSVYYPQKVQMPAVKYLKVKDIATLRQVADRVKQVDRIAYDLETNSITYTKAKILSVGVSWAKNTAVSWPLWVKDEEACNKVLEGLTGKEKMKMATQLDHDPILKKYWSDAEWDEAVKLTKEIFENTNCKKGGHNTFFDNLVLHFNGIEVKNYCYDTMVMKHLLDEEREKTLDYCSWIYTDKGGYKMEKEVYLKSDKSNYANIPLDVLLEYNAGDAAVTYELYDVFKPQILEQNLTFEMGSIRMPLQKALMEACIKGMRINREYLHTLDKELTQGIQECNEKILPYLKKYYGEDVHIINGKEEEGQFENEFNINSADNLKDLLFKKMKLKSNGTTENGAPSTNESALLKLARAGNEIADLILQRKKKFKFKTTYVDGMEDLMDENDRIHPSFNVCGTECVTGDTLILTDKGYKKMEDLGKYKDNSEIPHKENIVNLNRELEQTSYIVKYTNVPTIKLTTKFGFSLEGTYNHPIKVGVPRQQEYYYKGQLVKYKERGFKTEFKQLKDIKVGDYVELAIDTQVFPSEYVKTELKPYVGTKHQLIQGQIPEVYTEDFAEFIGMYMSDGSLNESNGSFRVSITNDDPNVQNRVIQLSNKLFGAHIYLNRKFGTYVTDVHLNGLFLKSLNTILPKGAKNKCVLPAIMRSPKAVVCSYIKGRTLDSTYNKAKHELKMTIVSKLESDFIQQFLLNLGILSFRTSGKMADGSIYYRISVSGNNYLKFIKEIGLIEPSKIDQFDYKEKQSSTICLDKKQVLAMVKNISFSKNNVFDVHVPGTHSFIAGGIVNHNTGRLSSSSPNVQQIPRDKSVKSIFEAPEGYEIMECDFSQAELRVMAALSNDMTMKHIYDQGRDLHMELAVTAFHKPASEITKEQRTIAKTINFLIGYSGGPDTLKANLSDGGVEISKSEAERLINTWHGKFKEASSYLNSCNRRFQQNGLLITPFGRRRRMLRTFSDDYLNQKLGREGQNFMIQSTAGELAFISLINIAREVKQYGGTVISTVHDSILIEYPKEQRKNIAQICKKYTWVTYPFLNGLYMKSDCECDKVWGHKKPINPDTGEYIEED